MVIHKPPDVSPVVRLLSSTKSVLYSETWHRLVIFSALFVTVVALQAASGAYHSEFGAYPDEPGHYVTSLMVREYITGPDPICPMQFAESYYAHYPKVALGHWPPLFYSAQALWMVLFSATRISVRLELAFTTALLAFSVYSLAKRRFGECAGVLAGLLTICIPLVQASTNEEMSETLLALTCFWSTVYFARYMDSGSVSDALWFGTFFSLAVLTKGSGWLLVFVPAIAAPLASRIRLFFCLPFWFAIGEIAVCCLPWQFMTMQLAARGWTGGAIPNAQYTAVALVKFAGILISVLGPILTAGVVIGIAIWALLPIVQRRRCEALPAAMLALIVGDWVFHSLVPAGVENRKMIMAAPALVLFLVAGGVWVAETIPAKGSVLRYRVPLVALAIGAVFFAQTFRIPGQKPFGYIEAAKFITSDPSLSLHAARILVSSESMGEGLLVSEIAMREPRPHDTILRGTKVLADVDWNGSRYYPHFRNTQQLSQFIRESRIDLVVIDDFPRIANFSHNQLLIKTVKENPNRFRLLRTFESPASKGSIQVFKVRKDS